MKTLFHIAVPYLLLAVLFAALMQQAQYGFFQMTEDITAYVLQQLAAGVFPLDAELGVALSSAPLFMPFYLLWVAITGSADGFVYFARLMVTALSFAVALAVFQVGSKRGYRNESLMIAAAVMLLSSMRVMGLVLGFAIVLASAAGLLVWCAFAQCLEDDGTQTGYARVLVPFFAGILLAFSFLCSWVAVLLVALFLGQGLARFRAQGKSCASFVWAVVGVAVAAVVLLIYLIGFDNPASIIATYGHAAFSSGGTVPGVDNILASLSIVFYLFALALAFGIALAFNAGKLTERGAWLVIAGVLVFSVAAQGLWMASARVGSPVTFDDGPAAHLVVSEENAAAYGDVRAAARAVGNDSVWVESSNKWMPLMFENALAAKAPDTLWMFVASDIADELEDGAGINAGYAPILQNSAGTLYRTASKQSYISQG